MSAAALPQGALGGTDEVSMDTVLPSKLTMRAKTVAPEA
jgi:hypothetical protein